jgi:hypothetical protein
MVCDNEWARDWPLDAALLKKADPPIQVGTSVFWGGARKERTVMEDSEKGLQGGEVGLSHGGNIACVHEFAMQGLCFLKCVSPACSPSGNGRKIFGLFVVGDGDCPGLKIPEKTDEWKSGGKRNIFRVLPWDAQLIGEAIDVSHAVVKLRVQAGTRGCL